MQTSQQPCCNDSALAQLMANNHLTAISLSSPATSHTGRNQGQQAMHILLHLSTCNTHQPRTILTHTIITPSMIHQCNATPLLTTHHSYTNSPAAPNSATNPSNPSTCQTNIICKRDWMNPATTHCYCRGHCRRRHCCPSPLVHVCSSRRQLWGWQGR